MARDKSTYRAERREHSKIFGVPMVFLDGVTCKPIKPARLYGPVRSSPGREVQRAQKARGAGK